MTDFGPTYPELAREPSIRVTDRPHLDALLGEPLPASEWHVVTQARIDAFARATADCQWIHVNPERARSESAFGGTIAHGYLTLSLLPMLMAEVISFGDLTTVNYGLDRVRFPAPLRSGASVRAEVNVSSVDHAPGGTKVTFDVTAHADAGGKPVCVARPMWIVLFGD